MAIIFNDVFSNKIADLEETVSETLDDFKGEITSVIKNELEHLRLDVDYARTKKDGEVTDSINEVKKRGSELLTLLNDKVTADGKFNKTITQFIKICLERSDNEIAELKERNSQLENELANKEKQINTLLETITELCGRVGKLDEVELFCLKTYRGWKWLYLNGVPRLLEGDAPNDVTIRWSKGEKVDMYIAE